MRKRFSMELKLAYLIARKSIWSMLFSTSSGLLSLALISYGLSQILVLEDSSLHDTLVIFFSIFVGGLLSFISGYIKINQVEKLAVNIFSSAEEILFPNRARTHNFKEKMGNTVEDEDDDQKSGKIVLLARCINVFFQFVECLSLYIFSLGFCIYFDILLIFLILHIFGIPLLLLVKRYSNKIQTNEIKFRSCKAEKSLEKSAQKILFFKYRFLYFSLISFLAIFWFGLVSFVILNLGLISGNSQEIILLIFVVRIVRVASSSWGMWQRYFPILARDENLKLTIFMYKS